MQLLHFLGLAPARDAIRRLIRRPSTAGSHANGSAGVPSSSPQSTSTDANASQHSQQPITGETQQVPEMAAVMDYYSAAQADKENRPPQSQDIIDLSVSLKKLSFADQEPLVAVKPEALEEDPQVLAERAHHLFFIGEALDMARLALRTNETPVGCVLVHKGTIIAKGMNATNVTRNGTRHAEFMAISALLSYPPKRGPRTTSLKPKPPAKPADEEPDGSSVELKPPPDEGNEDGKKGHLYPYGQKLHPDARVSSDIVKDCVLYVTVEPCVMCASFLRQLGIKKVYFGAVNDKFGGTGGVFSIHANSLPVRADGQTASAHPTPRPSQLPDGSGTLGTSYPPGGGDGGNVEAGYEIEGGWGRDEAVGLLRRFYVQENGRAPVPRKKEGRAARLAALMEQDDNSPVSQAAIAVSENEGQNGGMRGDVLGAAENLPGTPDTRSPMKQSRIA